MIKYLRASKKKTVYKLLVELITWITLLFHYFLGMVMYAYELKTKEQQKLTKNIKN